MKEISSKFVGLKTRPIRVKVPASVAYDFGKMTKITESILGKLGCPGCHSGFDIRFDIERDFIFNERLEIVKGMWLVLKKWKMSIPESGVGIIYFSGFEQILESNPDLIQVIEIEPQTFWYR